jgi:hypothetical protein
MKILFVPGILCPWFIQNGLRKDLQKRSEVDAVKVRTDFYVFLHTKQCERIIDSIRQDIVSGKPDIVICHSFGGLLVKRALQDLGTHSVKVYCSLGTPHLMEYGGVERAVKKLHIPVEPTGVLYQLTYGGSLDLVVPNRFTKLPNSIHTTLPAWHSGLLLKRSAREVYINDCIALVNLASKNKN